MESQVIFRDRQEMQAKDFNNFQSYAANSLAHVVYDGVTDEKKFVGFAVSQTGTTQVQVATGRFYAAGAVYPKTIATPLELFSYIPVATRRILSIVVYGLEADTEIEPRDFIVDLTTGETEPDAVPMRKERYAQIDVVAGVESADPVAPAIPDATITIATVTLSTSGIVEISYKSNNVLPSTKGNAAAIFELESWRARTGTQLESMSTSIAGLEDKTDGMAERGTVVRLASEVATLRDGQGIPDDASLSGADEFADEDESETVASQYDAEIEDGVVFPAAATAEDDLTLFNPLDTGVKVDATDWVLPAYTEIDKLKIDGYSGDISISQYQVQTHTLKKYTRYEYRWRWAWGVRSPYWWRYYAFRHHPSYRWWYRDKLYYRYPVTIYKDEVTTTSYDGQIIGQTWLAPSTFWLTSIKMMLTQAAVSGNVQVVICETDYGKPNLNKIISQTTVDAADLKKYPTYTSVPVPAAIIEAGKRYATMFITTGDHRMATVSGNDYTQGTFFYGSDGEYFTGDITKNLMFTVMGAAFKQPRTEVVLNSISLSGGLTDLKIETQSQVPDGTSLSYEVQIAGKWYPLETADLATAKPAVLPLRAIMLGTRDAAPGFQLGTDRLLASRPAEAVTHVSTLRTMPGSDTTTDVTVFFLLSGYDSDDHTFVVRLLDDSDAELATADATTFTVVQSDTEETITEVKAVFNTISPAITEYKVEFTGTRTPSAQPYQVLRRQDAAIPV